MKSNDEAVDRQNRINFLLRKSQGERNLPVFTKQLAAALQVPISSLSFLSLEQSDSIDEKFTDFCETQRSYLPTFRVTWSDTTPIGVIAKNVADRIPSRLLYVMFHDSNSIGIMAIEAKLLFCSIVKILMASGEAIQVFSADFTDGVLLDFYEEGPTGITVECLAWGCYQPIFAQCLDDYGDFSVIKIW